jgi:hypothetical protein
LELRTYFSDTGTTISRRCVSESNYSELLWRHDEDSLWMSEEVERCIRAHWSECVLRLPQLLDAAGNIIEHPTFEQLRPHLIDELKKPILFVIQRHQTFEPTKGQIIDSYRGYKEDISAPMKTVL